MSVPFIGEVKMFAFGQVIPKGWHACDGALLAVNQWQALFAVLGTTYGGDGVKSFALPDLRGRAPLSFGGGLTQGQLAGQEKVTLQDATIPNHSHVVQASSANGDTNAPAGHLLASAPIYAGPNDQQPLNGASVTPVGGQPHENMQPFGCVSFAIALVGIFPSRN